MARTLKVGDSVMYYPEFTSPEVIEKLGRTADRTEEIYSEHPYQAKVIEVYEGDLVDLHVIVHPDSGLEKDKANFHLREGVPFIDAKGDAPESRYCKYP